MEYNCPICQRKLTKEHKISHIDYHCYPPLLDHHYAKRVDRENKLLQVKIRLTEENDTTLYYKIDLEENQSYVWTKPGAIDKNRIKIDYAIIPDFTDLEKLKLKLKTYIIFS